MCFSFKIKCIWMWFKRRRPTNTTNAPSKTGHFFCGVGGGGGCRPRAGFTKRLERFGPPNRRPQGRGQGRPRVQSRRLGSCQPISDGLTARDGGNAGNAGAIASSQKCPEHFWAPGPPAGRQPRGPGRPESSPADAVPSTDGYTTSVYPSVFSASFRLCPIVRLPYKSQTFITSRIGINQRAGF
jgi:hypothetical protein